MAAKPSLAQCAAIWSIVTRSGGGRGQLVCVKGGEKDGCLLSGAMSVYYTWQQRTSTPYNDYDRAADALYAAWWPLLPLKQGLRRGKAILDSKWRHMFCCEPCTNI